MAKKDRQGKNDFDFLSDDNTWGAMPYFRYTRDEHQKIVESELSPTAHNLYIHMRLNCDTNRGISHTINYTELETLFDKNRTTLRRALIELEHKGFIQPRRIRDGETYNLPFAVEANVVAGESAKKRKVKEAERKFVAAKENMENVLCRRLSQSEVKRLKERLGI